MSTRQFTVALPPHERASGSVATIMWSVVVALLPTTLAGVYFYGVRALVVTLVAAGACAATEYLVERFMLRRNINSVSDGSAVVTGMLLAFNVPAGIPFWQLVVGSFVSIAIAKSAFGGIGRNPFNPALIGRAFMLVSFPVSMTTWPVPAATPRGSFGVNAVTGPTPLGLVKDATAPLAEIELPSYADLFVGNIGGCIGEAGALAVLVGCAFLVWRRSVDWVVPTAFLGALAVVTGVAWVVAPERFVDPLYHLLAGGAMLGACFMVTDMTTTPMTVRGRVLFAAGAGTLTGLIRLFGGFPEGVSYSILIMNALVPVIDRYVRPRVFGPKKGVTR